MAKRSGSQTSKKQSQESSRLSDQEQELAAEQEQDNRLFFNVAADERVYSALAGGALTLLGLRRRSTFGAVLAVIGGSLIYRGATGHCSMYSALGTTTNPKN